MARERRDHTLQPTALVHEAYLKLADKLHPRWRDRSHFFAVSAQLMRRILVDHARSHRAAKRGGDWLQISLSELPEGGEEAFEVPGTSGGLSAATGSGKGPGRRSPARKGVLR